MEKICIFCRRSTVRIPNEDSSGGFRSPVCKLCADRFHKSSGPAALKVLADGIDAPVLVLQSEPRLVYTANDKALQLFDKELNRIEKHKGGQVFDCIHAFTEAGCGKDVHCEPCRIKNAIVETLASGEPFTGVSAVLETIKGGDRSSYELRISTEKIGDMALVHIEDFKRALDCSTELSF